jgi:putative protease
MNPPTDSVPELLAPAGNEEALRAAAGAGADAVYLGIDRLNARRGADNFTLETLADACRFAHVRGVLVYLTVNVIVLPDELAGALELVDTAWSLGVDAIIVQDLGLLRAVRESLPHVRMHASTQFNTHSSTTVRALAGRGVARVTLARETSLSEMAALVGAGRASGTEVESFVHGALCMGYSGQCLLSSMVGGRSANRGQCAQPCRLPFELLDERGAVIETPGAHLLSPKDLFGIELLPRLIGTGVRALKIEGRMKSAEYVALVTGVYRAALDRAAEQGEDFSVRDGELDVLNEAFSRGFTSAYMTHERGNAMMSYSRPNNRGVPLGRVIAFDQGKATIALDTPVDSEDTIEVWTSRGRFAQKMGALTFDGATHRSAPSKAKVTISAEQPVGKGDRVFRVRNAALISAAQRVFAAGQPGAGAGLALSVKLVAGEPLSVTVTDEQGRTGAAEGPIVEAARTRPVSTDDVIEHVGRLGATAYHADSWDISLSPDVGIGFSALHKVRRDAIEVYEDAVLAPWAGRERFEPTLPYLARPYRELAPAPRLVAAVSTIASARAVIQAGCESAYVPAWELDGEALPPGVVPYLPRIAHDREQSVHLDSVRGASRVLVGTLGQLDEVASLGVEAETHWSLNAANAHAVAELADMGAAFVWLSPELSSRQIKAIASESVVPVGVAVSGRQELMVTEHCILMAEGLCKQGCATCSRRSKARYLRDRKDYELPVITDPTGRSHVYNAVPLDLTAALPELLGCGVSALRLDLETVHANIAASWVARVRQALQDTLAGREPVTPEKGTVTSGHFFRGVQ